MAVTIIGAGLAGSEAAWQIASRGIPVRLIEMRPLVMTKAHKTNQCAELVCSNSLRGRSLTNAVGLLKEELRRLGSVVMAAADNSEVPAGGALAVDRVLFSRFVDEKIRGHALIQFVNREVIDLPAASTESPVIVATGPLTSPSLVRAIERITGANNLAFFDAISPIILGETIDRSKVFAQSRYDKGGGDDYLNIPLSHDEYYAFVEEVRMGEKFGAHQEVESDMVDNLRPFEGCMPIEEMVERGPETLRFGPMKPVGLSDPRTGRRPYAVIQLRQDDKAGTLWSLVGFQTRLKHPEQQRIFRNLPGLENAEFVRLGSVHRNTFIDSPKCLKSSLEFRGIPGLFFAGQITGVEGYVESTACGLVAGINAARMAQNQELLTFPQETAIGALINYISDAERKNFQPMNVSFGLMPSYLAEASESKKIRKLSRDDRRLQASENALKIVSEMSELISAAG